MKILCTICARGNSKGIANKALKKINNLPLIGITIKQAVASKVFDEIVVSTDSKKIQKIAKQYGAKTWFLRPASLSNDYASKILAIRHALLSSEKYFQTKFDICVDLDITSPLRTVKDIRRSIKIFKQKKTNNLFSVCEAKKNPYFNMVEMKNKKIKLIKKIKKNNSKKKEYQTPSRRWSSFVRRQSSPRVFEMNAAIYIWSRLRLINSDTLFFKDTSIYVMPQNRSIDIDTINDLNLVKKIIGNDKKKFNNI